MGFAMYAPMLCVPPMEHIIKAELLLSHAQVSVIFSAPVIALAALALPSGALADRIGLRKEGGIGIITVIVGSLLRGTSTDFVTLVVFTCLYGAGFAMIFPILPKLVGSWFPPEKIGLATGIYTTGIIAGCALPQAITLSVVFPVTNTFQGTFYIWTIPAIAAAILWWILVKEPLSSRAQHKNMVEGNKPSSSLWANKPLWLIVILFFLLNFISYTLLGWTPQLMMMKGASPDLAALMSSFIMWVCLPTVLIVPWASAKVGLTKPFLWVSFMVLACMSLSAIYIPLSLGWFVTSLIGIAIGVLFSLILTLIPRLVPSQDVGKASGMVLSIAYIGGFVGPLIAGHIMDVTGTLKPDLIILISMAAVGTYFAIRLPKTGSGARA
jgi:CP family cyanate transporter-like MFS transporter